MNNNYATRQNRQEPQVWVEARAKEVMEKQSIHSANAVMKSR